jgi:hypothetical protein
MARWPANDIRCRKPHRGRRERPLWGEADRPGARSAAGGVGSIGDARNYSLETLRIEALEHKTAPVMALSLKGSSFPDLSGLGRIFADTPAEFARTACRTAPRSFCWSKKNRKNSVLLFLLASTALRRRLS